MTTEGTQNPKVSRTAILAADIARYSAIMGADEARTVRDLKGHQAVILPMIADHGGRIIDTARDGILAEFGSVVNAVECAVTIQKTMAERNAGVDPDRRMQFRIGVNLGTSYTTRRASTATASTLLPAWRALRNRAPFASRERSTTSN